MKKIKTRGLFLPPNHTSEIQALDISINFPFKCAFREIWSNYMSSTEQQFTTHGNRKTVSSTASTNDKCSN